MNKPALTYADYQRAAAALNVTVAAIRAVVAVESSGSGFLPDGRCVIRFEPHIFSARTKRRYDATHPQLSYQPWRPGYPSGVSQSWVLFKEAAALDANAAVMATSWGLFQIMGFNATACGCATLGEFVKTMQDSESGQLSLFTEFIDAMGLADELRRKDWAGFARQYNGAQYAVNKYDTRLAEAYARYGGK